MSALNIGDRVTVDPGTLAARVGAVVKLDAADDGTPRVWVRVGTRDGARTRLVPAVDLELVRVGAPIAATGTWQTVMDRAGHRCQCTYQRHPAHRGHEGGRCEHTTGDTRLIAGLVSPGAHPERIVSAPPVEELMAWCLGCWDDTVKTARKSDRERELLQARHGEAEGLW